MYETGGAVDLLRLKGGEVELQVITGGAEAHKAPLVLLHEGLGSLGMWRDYPTRLAALTGRTVVVWSRHGYGQSRVPNGPRTVKYMHHEALDVLPELLGRIEVSEPVLVGHSDGASIALIYAGCGAPVAGVVAIAPHVMVEEHSLKGIEAARREYLRSDLPTQLRRYHRDVDTMFWGWNDIWLSPAFRDWNIEASLPGITCPVLLVQCEDDRYGTLEQLDRIAQQVAGPTEQLVIPEGGHSPHVTRPELVEPRLAAFVAGLD